MARTIFRWVLAFLAFLAITVTATALLQANVQELARARGWDQYAVRIWEPAMIVLADIAALGAQPWAIFVSGFLVGGAVCVWGDYILRGRGKALDTRALTRVVGKHFMREPVHLDGFAYINCTFTGVRFIYKGGPFSLQHNNFDAPPVIEPATPELERLVGLMGEFGYLATGVMGQHGPITFHGVQNPQGAS